MLIMDWTRPLRSRASLYRKSVHGLSSLGPKGARGTFASASAHPCYKFVRGYASAISSPIASTRIDAMAEMPGGPLARGISGHGWPESEMVLAIGLEPTRGLPTGF